MKIRELTKYRERLDESRASSIRADAEYKKERKRLKQKYNISTAKQAKREVKKLNKKLAELEEKRDSLIEKLQEMLGEDDD